MIWMNKMPIQCLFINFRVRIIFQIIPALSCVGLQGFGYHMNFQEKKLIIMFPIILREKFFIMIVQLNTDLCK